MAGTDRKYTEVSILGDGFCGYSAQALFVALHVLDRTENTPGIQLIIAQINAYYGVNLSFLELQSFLRLLRNNRDIEHFLVPVLYQMHREFDFSNSSQRVQAASDCLMVLDQKFGLLSAVHTSFGAKMEAQGVDAPSPRFIYSYSGSGAYGHYNARVDVKLLKGHECLITNQGHGYLAQKGVGSYAFGSARQGMAALIRAHVSAPSSVKQPRSSDAQASAVVVPVTQKSQRFKVLNEFQEQKEVQEINMRANQLLTAVYGKMSFKNPINDELARKIQAYLDQISDSKKSNQERLAILSQAQHEIIFSEKITALGVFSTATSCRSVVAAGATAEKFSRMDLSTAR